MAVTDLIASFVFHEIQDKYHRERQKLLSGAETPDQSYDWQRNLHGKEKRFKHRYPKTFGRTHDYGMEPVEELKKLYGH